MSELYNSGDISRPLTDGPTEQTGWYLWGLWVAATVAGALASLIIELILSGLAADVGLTRVPGSGELERLIFAALYPGLLATFQYLVLRRYLPGVSPLLWIGLTLLAAIAVYLLGEVARPLLPGAQLDASGNPLVPTLQASYVTMGVFALLRGAFTGVAQWAALNAHLRDAWTWMVAKTGTALLLFFLSFGVLTAIEPQLKQWFASPGGTNPVLVNLGILGLSGLIEGAIMGYLLVVLYRGTVNETVVEP